MPARAVSLSQAMVHKVPGCTYGWANLSESILETKPSLVCHSTNAALGCVKLLNKQTSYNPMLLLDLERGHELLCRSHLAGGSIDPMVAVTDAQRAVHMCPSSLSAWLSLAMAYRSQVIQAEDVSKGVIRRYRLTLDAMKKFAGDGENLLINLLTLDATFLSAFATDDAKRRRDALAKAYKEGDRMLKAAGDNAPLQGLCYWFLARSLLGLGMLKKALISYKNAVQFLPNHMLLWMVRRLFVNCAITNASLQEFSDVLHDAGLTEASAWVDRQVGVMVAPSESLSVLGSLKSVAKYLAAGGEPGKALEQLSQCRQQKISKSTARELQALFHVLLAYAHRLSGPAGDKLQERSWANALAFSEAVSNAVRPQAPSRQQ